MRCGGCCYRGRGQAHRRHIPTAWRSIRPRPAPEFQYTLNCRSFLLTAHVLSLYYFLMLLNRTVMSLKGDCNSMYIRKTITALLSLMILMATIVPTSAQLSPCSKFHGMKYTGCTTRFSDDCSTGQCQVDYCTNCYNPNGECSGYGCTCVIGDNYSDTCLQYTYWACALHYCCCQF